MLGPLQVTRVDGTQVQPREWRTGKTTDLLRLLALRFDDPVPVGPLIDALWPSADRRHGQASLRTAASQIRQVLGQDSLTRSPTGLSLRGVRVDVVAFRSLAAEVNRLMAVGKLGEIAAIARRADALYRGELRAFDDGAEWAQSERRRLNRTRNTLLCDAAEASMAGGIVRDALDYAARAVADDPFSERASRLLMLSYAGRGEISPAIREYERCRKLLAEELGVDPSPQTRAVHLQLLRNQASTTPAGDSRQQPGPSSVLRGTAPSPHQGSATSGMARSVVADEPTPNPVSRIPSQSSEAQAESCLRRAIDLCVQRREFAAAGRSAAIATSLSVSPTVQARAVIVSHLPDMLLGRPRVAQAAIERAAELAGHSGDTDLKAQIEVIRCLVAHDAESHQFDELWSALITSSERDSDIDASWAIIRVATERGDLETAQSACIRPVAARQRRLVQQLRRLAEATLLTRLGQFDTAGDQLRGLIDEGTTVASALFLPEALARLVIVVAQSDVVEAKQLFVRLNKVLGADPHPRVAYFWLLARAAIQSAEGRAAAAATSAARAAEVAEENGLHALAASGHESCAEYTALASARYRLTARTSVPAAAQAS
jgi:DNA-binding SARP family transcriptional activator